MEARARLLNPPTLSPHVAHLWKWFADPVQGIACTRPNNGMAISRIPRSEIAQWERDEGITLQTWERRALLQLDAAYVAAMSAQRDSKSARSDPAPVEEEV